MYPAVRSRHPLWSWVGCEGGVRRKEVEDVDGEEEEVVRWRPGPCLQLKLSNEINNKVNECKSKRLHQEHVSSYRCRQTE